MEISKCNAEIKQLIDEHKLDDALAKVEEIIASGCADDMTYYFRGNAYRRCENWKGAIDSYTQAIEMNPESPAVAARTMVISILEFYNTDMYNH
ncbi:MAG: tetratricopeptide repeat protein [Bacteroidales bacterium]|jgi:cytochrome c-type biogenesis protein CcmH/NrfG|nr:tetratricopeptide repeat protein [Bacteroidales bacterium]